MQNQNSEILTVLIIGAFIAVLLVLFIVAMVFLYQSRQQRYEKEMVKLKEEFDQELLRSQLEIQEKTLKTISQELHDNVGQMLSVVKLTMASAGIKKEDPAYQTIFESREILNKAILDLGNLTKSLHTDRITQIGLDQAIEFEINTIRRTGLMPIEFTHTKNDSIKTLDPQKSIFLFRMFQEILNNTLKHSKATLVNVSINYTKDNIFILKIADNGVGFDVEEKKDRPSASGGVGLKSMINRAKLINAKFIINSKIGTGTSITITLPLQEEPIPKEE
ncbi:signal transduction histidine-protein kinase/phosphatase DegS [mine drainage metagenome]|uniref:histidine kinase n=1 Tax=mine drainage metagenome TaxID=410659 RepID=A0A1J5SIP2_9ZZZZ